MMNKNVIVKIKMPFLHIAHHLEKVNLNCNKETFKLAVHFIASTLHVITRDSHLTIFKNIFVILILIILSKL